MRLVAKCCIVFLQYIIHSISFHDGFVPKEQTFVCDIGIFDLLGFYNDLLRFHPASSSSDHGSNSRQFVKAVHRFIHCPLWQKVFVGEADSELNGAVPVVVDELS